MFKSKGQATSEFVIIGTAVFVPIFLMLPIMSKYTDMKQKASEASRYAVWERTVWSDPNASWNDGENTKTDAVIAQEINDRVFGHILQGMTSNRVENTTWKDENGAPLIKSVKLNKMNEEEVPVRPTQALAVFEQVAYGGGIFETLGHKGLDLGKKTFSDAEVEVTVNNITVPGVVSEIKMTSSAGILSSSWSAPSQQEFYDRLSKLGPAKGVNTLMSPADLLCQIPLLYKEGCNAKTVELEADWTVVPNAKKK
ncbi:MAG: hypothetical protein HON94_14985 [Methylococcales bacterium]|jgi:hypothetical protein|nr:hypothetical protein [Methylococcales bacterium]MBT7408242.1 hypothetical protein [Methylococcales bacterium]